MTLEELKQLSRHAARRTAPENFSVENVDQALADEFSRMAATINDFNRNKYDIFDIIIENADTIVPAKVMEQMSPFAEIRNVKQGEKVYFKRGPLGRNRAKKFLTQVGLSGVYETFRLDSETFTVGIKAIGGAVTIDFERMMDGAETLSEFMDVLAEAQVDAIYAEIQKALMTATAGNNMPSRNKVAGSYSAANLQEIVNTVKAYGGGATIFASPEFVQAMGPDVIAPTTFTTVTAGNGLRAFPVQDDIDAIHKTGSIKIFRGTPIVEFRQSFLDEKNEKVLIHPQYAYILPTGGKEKVVKIVMEGATQMWSETNKDQSIEINSYRKVGVGILAYNNWGCYQNTGISASDWVDNSLGIDNEYGPVND